MRQRNSSRERGRGARLSVRVIGRKSASAAVIDSSLAQILKLRHAKLSCAIFLEHFSTKGSIV